MAFLRVLFFLGILCLSGAVDLGISFNETMEGFFTNGDLDFQTAYDEGKAADRWIHFAGHVEMSHMRSFVADHQHAAALTGRIFVRGITGLLGAKFEGGILNLFNNTVVDHQMQMNYYIPFLGADGQPYHLQGVKHIKGDNCTHFFYMATTLFTHVRRGVVRGQGPIVSSSILQINPAKVVSLAASIRVLGNGTDADKLDALAEFATFLLKDVATDCFNSTNWESQFWYIWASNGTSGFLLDLIARPDTLELRLETYTAGQAPVVRKQLLSIDDLTVASDGVAFGDTMTLTMTGCRGTVNGFPVVVEFALHDMNDFVPPLVVLATKGLVPQIESHYGIARSAMVGPTSFSNVALARTTYTFQAGLKAIEWVMISALSFTDSELRIEAIAAKLSNNSYLGSSYVFFRGMAYHLNDPALTHTAFTSDSGLIVNGTRTFVVRITKRNEIDFTVKCAAPASEFAFLEQEGKTVIHTTVLGFCTATDAISKSELFGGNALLEIKGRE